jgi:hypothetical protein
VKKKLILLLAILAYFIAGAQERVTTVGIVVKPIFPSRYFRTGPKTTVDNNVQFTITQNSGFSAGGVIRYGISKTLSIESGISYVKRQYGLEIQDTTATFNSSYKVIGYEIPLQALVFIRLSNQLWMNAGLGPSLDLFPSDVRKSGEHFVQETRRKNANNIAKAGVIANIGWEFRTKNSGYIYLGSTYHRSLANIYTTYVVYLRNPKSLFYDAATFTPLNGDYISVDLRYYFHEKPRDKKPKKAE